MEMFSLRVDGKQGCKQGGRTGELETCGDLQDRCLVHPRFGNPEVKHAS
jgi:hypothetical protein